MSEFRAGSGVGPAASPQGGCEEVFGSRHKCQEDTDIGEQSMVSPLRTMNSPSHSTPILMGRASPLEESW